MDRHSLFRDRRGLSEIHRSGESVQRAVIERYSLKPIGATMVVCADQAIPRDWVRERDQDASAGCPGARVREGERTAVTIRRVSQR